MKHAPTVLYFGGPHSVPPAVLQAFVENHDMVLVRQGDGSGVMDRANRSFPACLVLDATGAIEEALSLCRRIKADPFTSIIPVAIFVPSHPPGLSSRGLEAGADEVLREGLAERELELRLELLLRRAARDVSVHPTTRLPGTVQIERDLAGRIDSGSPFAVCYADLDHFKEFNDRYSYAQGDRVILLTARILRDVVRALAPDGFVGHIGGDDFIFSLAVDGLDEVCAEILFLFDEIIPYQYSEADRAAGYFLGQDRRGTVHRVPLMTLSIGVVTNRLGQFDHPAQLGERAAEMKAFAKTIPGSVYVVDRRSPSSGRLASDEGPMDSSAVQKVEGTMRGNEGGSARATESISQRSAT
ncbi:MAG: diguanylate cyclase [Gemmatimonadales bacterium]|nr:MAG: diguanylate cyclase [Gemmatimonadales bacterium]